MKLIIAVFLLLSITTYGQQKVNPTFAKADRAGAVMVLNDTIICLKSPEGFGNTMEFSAPKTSKKSFEKEHNTLWYKIVPKKSCEFSFTLFPDKIEDDYDFILLECDSLCPNNSKLKTIRSNISRNDKNKGSQTGMKENSEAHWVGEGVGSSFSKSAKLKAGRVYFLVVDNVYKEGGGHRIILHYSNCEETQIISQKPKIVLKIENKETHKLIDARVLIIKKNYPESDDTIVNQKGQIIISALEENFFYDLFITADSCLAYKDEFKVYPEDSILNKSIALQKIEPGKKVIVDNIYFRGGTADFLRKSYPALKNLLFIMKENPKLEIEIQGHVNVPRNSTKKHKENYYQTLSEARALAVLDYLIKRGVASNRLKYKGFGYSAMLFPYAQSEKEMQQNRRVEILIKKM